MGHRDERQVDRVWLTGGRRAIHCIGCVLCPIDCTQQRQRRLHSRASRSSLPGRKMIRSLLVLLSWLVLFHLHAANAQTLARLDSLVEAGMTPELSIELRSGGYDKKQLEEWLRRRAEEGHPLPQYELALHLGKENIREALKWFARARMAHVLDSAECARGSEAGALGWALDLGYQSLEMLARENEAVFSTEIEQALTWEATRAQIFSPKWICGESKPPSEGGNTLPAPERQAARYEALSRLKSRSNDMAAYQRLIAQRINPGRFGILTAPFVGIPLRWLDNERLYVSLPSGIPLPPALKSKMPSAAEVIWNVATNEVIEAKGLPRRTFCYVDGYISYTRIDGDYTVYVAGQLGQEKEVARRRARAEGKQLPLDGLRYQNRFNCQWFIHERVGKALKYPLLDEHGFIEVEDDGRRLVFFPKRDVASVTLPFSYDDVQRAIYVAALGVYVVPENILGSSSRRPLTFWLLTPNGGLRRETIPAGPLSGVSHRFHASRAGIVVWSRGQIGRGDDNYAGVYLVRSNEAVRILSGLSNGSDVSPNGCRIAAGLAHIGGTPELKVVDVCRERLAWR